MNVWLCPSSPVNIQWERQFRWSCCPQYLNPAAVSRSPNSYRWNSISHLGCTIARDQTKLLSCDIHPALPTTWEMCSSLRLTTCLDIQNAEACLHLEVLKSLTHLLIHLWITPRAHWSPAETLELARRLAACSSDGTYLTWCWNGSKELSQHLYVLRSPPRALRETETRARRRTSLFSTPKRASFEATTNIASKLHCWGRTEEEEAKVERHRREESRPARILDPDQKVAKGILRTRQPD